MADEKKDEGIQPSEEPKSVDEKASTENEVIIDAIVTEVTKVFPDGSQDTTTTVELEAEPAAPVEAPVNTEQLPQTDTDAAPAQASYAPPVVDQAQGSPVPPPPPSVDGSQPYYQPVDQNASYQGQPQAGQQIPPQNPYPGQQVPPAYGQQVPPHNQAQQPYYYQQPYQAPTGASKDHVAAGLLGIFLGALGIHKFYLGYNTPGFIMLAVSIIGGLLTCSVATWVVWIIGVVEGIIYLTKSQGEFDMIYVANKREWF